MTNIIIKLQNKYQERIEQLLDDNLPQENQQPEQLHQAMRYTVIGNGKRLRPLLVYACGEALNIPPEKLDQAATAVELIHCYSLVHDDLPTMDNDDLRRGKPTCHKVYDEATALLVGDALQSLAFITLTQPHPKITPQTQAEMVQILSSKSGSTGMAGGQAIDLQATGKTLPLNELTTMHKLKTGALIKASILLPTTIDDCPKWKKEALTEYAENIGLAFQVTDDILDVEADTQTLGKRQGADSHNNKATFPKVLGLKQSKDYALELAEKAQQKLEKFDNNAQSLIELANHVVARKS